ncbi:hypothetical protein HDU96_003075 [Phlyctochytrium bullatum]|nr:hypothetical protein HDU96_003075 [Phlyctochytrium bullatum]
MQLNADLAKPASVDYSTLKFVDSPQAGVQRGMLDRDGDEVARATSLVRYAPNSTFNEHTHGGGEEFLVVQGTFADNHGKYPVGTYVRNKVGSSHAPSVGADGCLIFVKLRFMHPEEPGLVVYDAVAPPDLSLTGKSWVRELFQSPVTSEKVATVGLATGERLAIVAQKGLEVFVFEGAVDFGGKTYPKFSWIRLPAGADLSTSAIISQTESVCFVKFDHLY